MKVDGPEVTHCTTCGKKPMEKLVDRKTGALCEKCDHAAALAHIKKQEDAGAASNPHFFDAIDDELNKLIVGEQETRRTILLVALGGRLTENAMPTSSNLMVNDESGAGKDYIVKRVLDIFPPYHVERQKRISPAVFTYWHNANAEPQWSWDGKVVSLEDISNTVLNSSVFKVMSSSDGENKSTVVINQRAVEVLTRGKPVMIITIAAANPKLELLRRFPMVNLDTSEQQTRRILERKAEFHEAGIVPEYLSKVKKGIVALRRVKVRVPFTKKLTKVLDPKHIIIRTHFDRFVDYIKYSAAIHQHNRERDEKGYILATGDDYDIARVALLKTTSNAYSVPLTRDQRRLLEVYEELGDLWFTVTELERYVTWWTDRTLRRHLQKLTAFGFFENDLQDRDGSKKPVLCWRLVGVPRIQIPTYGEIMSGITSVSSMSSVSSVSSDIRKERTVDTLVTNETEIEVTEEVIHD